MEGRLPILDYTLLPWELQIQAQHFLYLRANRYIPQTEKWEGLDLQAQHFLYLRATSLYTPHPARTGWEGLDLNWVTSYTIQN